jgi:hypothetical protein
LSANAQKKELAKGTDKAGAEDGDEAVGMLRADAVGGRDSLDSMCMVGHNDVIMASCRCRGRPRQPGQYVHGGE